MDHKIKVPNKFPIKEKIYKSNVTKETFTQMMFGTTRKHYSIEWVDKENDSGNN